MKQLKCEMCGSTELLKEDGVFVCQTCGTKYSLEEAKKMMVEIEGAVVVKNTAQLENLLNLAHSSFDSKNYSQAEEFCNQVIAMDDKNYDAWKLKGEAINYQINANNQRILEVYNCIMTSYRVLPEEEKGSKKVEIISLLKTCFEGEVDFWLKQFEAGRPTKAALTRAKNAYIDAYNKMKAAFEELEFFEELKEVYLTGFDNFFVNKCNAICNDAWVSTVGYNYYRDYMGEGNDPFGRTDTRWVISNTDLYRPSKHIWDTFIEEADNLISLLQFAEEQFNDYTNPKVMEAIYSNIVFFEKCIIPSGSWKITQGYTSNWDEYKTVGWHEEYNLSDNAKNLRRDIINVYKAKKRAIPEKVEARKKAKKEKQIAKYWEEHAEEKKRLDSINKQISDIENKNAPLIDELTKERDKELPIEIEVKIQEEIISNLEYQRSKCGIFKGKEKKAITERINTIEQPKLEKLEQQAENEKKLHIEKINQQIDILKNEGKELREEADKLNNPINELIAKIEKEISI